MIIYNILLGRSVNTTSRQYNELEVAIAPTDVVVTTLKLIVFCFAALNIFLLTLRHASHVCMSIFCFRNWEKSAPFALITRCGLEALYDVGKYWTHALAIVFCVFAFEQKLLRIPKAGFALTVNVALWIISYELWKAELILDQMKRKMWLQVSWRNHINAGFERALIFHLSNRFPIKPQTNTVGRTVAKSWRKGTRVEGV